MSYCIPCRKKEIEARKAAVKAEEERQEREACECIKGECNRCGDTGTYLDPCDCGGTFDAIVVKDEDDHIKCLDCKSKDLAIVPKKRMLVKCTKCCEFKPCSKFGFRQVSENVDMKIMARFDVPLAKRRKSQWVAVRSIVVDSDNKRDIQYVPDEVEAAQLDLKPAANVASSNSTTNSNHEMDIYPSLFEFVSCLFPFLVTCYLCY